MQPRSVSSYEVQQLLVDQPTSLPYGYSSRFLKEEIANSLTHGLGLLLAIAGSIWLIGASVNIADFSVQLGCWLYAATLVGVYAASTLSHVVLEPKRRHFFRSLDQGAIFLFMAGNFSPVAISLLTSSRWQWVLPVMWVVALTGFCSKVFWKHRVESISMTHYLAADCLPIISMQPVTQLLPEAGLFWCGVGGVCYLAGTVFLISDQKGPYFHSVWHLLVIAGSSCHFIAVIKYVLPA